MSEKPIEIFETFQGDVLVFLGQWGSEGVLLHRAETGWRFFPHGSATWDSYHQETYRNFRVDALSREELEKRGISIPALEPYWDRPAVAWEDNFESAIALIEVSSIVRSKMERDDESVHLVMVEDTYETSFGDGRFVYPEAAFWDSSSAEAYLGRRQREEKDPAKAQWYRYYVKEVRLHVDRSHQELRADLSLTPYEHCSVKDILRLLAESQVQSGD